MRSTVDRDLIVRMANYRIDTLTEADTKENTDRRQELTNFVSALLSAGDSYNGFQYIGGQLEQLSKPVSERSWDNTRIHFL